jgi:hypothetical protein
MDHRHIYPVVRSFRAWFILPVVFWLAEPAPALQVQGLYRAAVPVVTQDQSEREAAFKTALETVLVRAAGSRDILDQPAAQTLLASAPTYVQQFGYQGTRPMALWVRFDGAALRAAMRDAGLPIWAEERPAVLIWVAIERQGNRYLIAEDSRKRDRMMLQNAAVRRGVPILLPLLDLEDRSQVSATDVLAGFSEAVVAASERYAPDAIAIARVSAGPDGRWSAHWELDYGGESLDWDIQGATLDVVLGDGMSAIADALGERLAVVESAGGENGLLIAVEGVDSLKDYAELYAYLDRLELVQDYRTHRVAPGYASFWLRVNGDADDLGRSISLGNLLQEAPAPEGWTRSTEGSRRDEQQPALHFRLLR